MGGGEHSLSDPSNSSRVTPGLRAATASKRSVSLGAVTSLAVPAVGTILATASNAGLQPQCTPTFMPGLKGGQVGAHTNNWNVLGSRPFVMSVASANKFAVSVEFISSASIPKIRQIPRALKTFVKSCSTYNVLWFLSEQLLFWSLYSF